MSNGQKDRKFAECHDRQRPEGDTSHQKKVKNVLGNGTAKFHASCEYFDISETEVIHCTSEKCHLLMMRGLRNLVNGVVSNIWAVMLVGNKLLPSHKSISNTACQMLTRMENLVPAKDILSHCQKYDIQSVRIVSVTYLKSVFHFCNRIFCGNDLQTERQLKIIDQNIMRPCFTVQYNRQINSFIYRSMWSTWKEFSTFLERYCKVRDK